jgi:hypothetical protein
MTTGRFGSSYALHAGSSAGARHAAPAIVSVVIARCSGRRTSSSTGFVGAPEGLSAEPMAGWARRHARDRIAIAPRGLDGLSR